jgi:hypothetical protein
VELKELADELRKGDAWRGVNGELVARSGPDVPRKETASEWQLVYFAATCPECEITIDDDTIEAAVRKAKNAEQFLRIIAPQIWHDSGCRWKS